MDISAILPVSMGNESSSLNDDFSGQTAAGDNIFTKPMGQKTFFRTETNGLVCVSFVFDPAKVYGDDHHMASVTSDWMQDMRDALTAHLIDEKDIAPKTKTLEETIWDQLTTALPKDTLAKNLFSDKKLFEQYTALLKQSVTKTFIEEQALTKALREKKFSFSFEIAIDAYPSQLGGSSGQKINQDKAGVLTFHIEGIPDGKMPEPVADDDEDDEASKNKSKKRKTTDDAASSAKETKEKEKKEKEKKEKEKEKKDQEKQRKKQQEETDKLLKDLQLTEYYKNAHVETLKKFPLTASTFFEMVNRWFGSVVSRRAAKLEKKRNRNQLYH